MTNAARSVCCRSIIEPLTNLRDDRCVLICDCEIWLDRNCAFDEQAHGAVLRNAYCVFVVCCPSSVIGFGECKRRRLIRHLARNPQRFAARRQNFQIGAVRQKMMRQLRARFDKMDVCLCHARSPKIEIVRVLDNLGNYKRLQSLVSNLQFLHPKNPKVIFHRRRVQND